MIKPFLWAGFIVFVLVMLFIDLFIVGHRKPKPGETEGSSVVPPKTALGITAIFVTLALLFAGVIYAAYENHLMGPNPLSFSKQPMTGAVAVGEYLSVWVLEYAMSVDNLFVFTLVFSFFKVEPKYQHRVLFWGILGALVLRAAMIVLGAALVQTFTPILILFGLVLVWTSFKMLKSEDEKFDPSKSLAIRMVKRFFPVTDTIDCNRFFVNAPLGARQADGTCQVVRAATPLFLVLCVIEATDLLFAVDSIPAAFGTSNEPFIIFTANVFAIMGLRSLYFAIAGLLDMFRYLKPALAGILLFIGVKMIVTPPLPLIGWKGFHVNTAVSLGIIVLLLLAGVVASVLHKPKPKPEHAEPPA